MNTGDIEVVLSEYEVLNPAKKNLPFLIRGYNKVSFTCVFIITFQSDLNRKIKYNRMPITLFCFSQKKIYV